MISSLYSCQHRQVRTSPFFTRNARSTFSTFRHLAFLATSPREQRPRHRRPSLHSIHFWFLFLLCLIYLESLISVSAARLIRPWSGLWTTSWICRPIPARQRPNTLETRLRIINQHRQVNNFNIIFFVTTFYIRNFDSFSNSLFCSSLRTPRNSLVFAQHTFLIDDILSRRHRRFFGSQ